MRVPLAAIVGLLVAAVSENVMAAPSSPSERACLLAWNAPDNAANRMRVAAGMPWSSASLRPGQAGAVIWTRASTPRDVAYPACLLVLGKRRSIHLVTGAWRDGGVVRWSFGRIGTGRAPGGSNVRVLPDGRVTKVYRR